ncbi:MAG: hypothetical protein B7Y69_09270 [Sphingobacteriia bacterium 35-40-8]|nr:MAG: hypothetical protein B7Y69_09270 [Sphingobacteriia bacterium 35-40-8]
MQRRNHVQPLRRIDANHPVQRHVTALFFDGFGAAGADDQRDQRLQKPVTLGIGRQRIVP